MCYNTENSTRKSNHPNGMLDRDQRTIIIWPKLTDKDATSTTKIQNQNQRIKFQIHCKYCNQIDLQYMPFEFTCDNCLNLNKFKKNKFNKKFVCTFYKSE